MQAIKAIQSKIIKPEKPIALLAVLFKSDIRTHPYSINRYTVILIIIHMLDKIKQGIIKKVGLLKNAAKDPSFYRRGFLVKTADRLTKNQERLNQALLDLEDLAQSGNEQMSRRAFLDKAAQRAMRRGKPIINTPPHKPMEQLDDIIDSRIARKIAKKEAASAIPKEEPKFSYMALKIKSF